MFVSETSPAGTGSIFDDDWTPPRPESTVARPATRPAPPPAPAPISSNGPAGVHGPAVTPPTLNPPQNLPSTRRPVPPAADQAKSRKLMTELFAKDLADPSLPARRALARKLVDEAAKLTDAPADQFVVLGGAIEAAVEAGDLRLAFEAADRMADAFDLDALSLKTSAALKMPAKGYTANVAENLPAALGLFGPLESAEDFPAAARLVAVLRLVPVADPALRATVLNWAKEIDDARAARDRLAPALDKLKTSPQDPAANAAVGRYTALVLGDWERGLPMLARGDDPKLAALAKADLADPSDPAACTAVAEGWWDLAQSSTGRAKVLLLERAAGEYRLAVPELAGLERVVADKRITQADAAIAAAGPGAGAASAGRGGTIHLLPLVDDRDLARADWGRDGPAVVSDERDDACLTLPWLAPAEYDFAAEFSRLSGNGDVILSFPVGKGTCDFAVGADNNAHAMLGQIGDKWTGGNPTLTDASVPNNERHRIEVKVRRDGVGGYLDGKRLCYWQTNGDDTNGNHGYAARLPGFVALGSYKSRTAFYSVDVTDPRGAGSLARERDANGWIYNPAVLRPSQDGTILLPARYATIHGKRITFGQGSGLEWLGYWELKDDYLTWFVQAPAEGDYAVEIAYSCSDGRAGSSGTFGLETPASAGAAPLSLHTEDTGGWLQFHPQPLGKLHLPAGKQTLALRLTSIPKSGAMRFQQIVLTPAR
jgi:hypothetical protein